MHQPNELFPYAANDVSASKRRIASEQCWAEGNHAGNSDVDKDACFTKGLPHDVKGKVSKRAWDRFTQAIETRDPEMWDSIPMGGKDAKWVSPNDSVSFELEGPAPFSVGIPAAPDLNSPEAAADVLELYEKCLARDVPFSKYEDSKRLKKAAKRMSRLSGYTGPRHKGTVTSLNIFRGPTQGDVEGPYISQLLLLPWDRINTTHSQKYHFPSGKTDYMKTWNTALSCQNGSILEGPPSLSAQAKYIRTARDLAWYVHEELLSEPYLNALLVMKKLNVPFSSTNPYVNGQIRNQSNFLSLGWNDVMDLLSKVSMVASKAAWYHKWLVHQKLRPEAMGMIIQRVLDTDKNPFDIHPDIEHGKTMKTIYRKNGNLLLPQVYPEGSPCHPSYPSNHASVASACTTLLKMFFDEGWQFPTAYAPDDAGTQLVQVYTRKPLTLRDELDKMASNMSLGRNFAGVHYRSDANAGWLLGERVAIRLMQDMIQRYPERNIRFTFHTRDGSEVSIG